MIPSRTVRRFFLAVMRKEKPPFGPDIGAFPFFFLAGARAERGKLRGQISGTRLGEVDEAMPVRKEGLR